MNTTNETPINNPRMGCAFCARVQDMTDMVIVGTEHFCSLRCVTSADLFRKFDDILQGLIEQEQVVTTIKPCESNERLTEPNVSATAGHTAIPPAKESIDGRGSVAG